MDFFRMPFEEMEVPLLDYFEQFEAAKNDPDIPMPVIWRNPSEVVSLTSKFCESKFILFRTKMIWSRSKAWMKSISKVIWWKLSNEHLQNSRTISSGRSLFMKRLMLRHTILCSPVSMESCVSFGKIAVIRLSLSVFHIWNILKK